VDTSTAMAAGPTSRAAACDAMERELEATWDRIHATVGHALDETMLDIVNRVYWLGVTTGVSVFSKAIDGDYA
jgi:hypothetical protein